MSGKIFVLDSSDSRWDTFFEKMPVNYKDIYFSRWYYQLEEIAGHGVAKLFVYEDVDNFALYPFLINPVPASYGLSENYFDIETAYGYGGPILTSKDPVFIEGFEDSFLNYCLENNIIAEFIRFHPLIENHTIFKEKIHPEHNRTTVWLDLTKGEDRLWMEDVSSRYRNKIRGCVKNGLTSFESKDFSDFKRLYYETMDRDNANRFYYFGDEYFEKLLQNEKCFVLYIVDKDMQIIAGSILMYSDEYIHYHLGASLSSALPLHPNNMMLWEGAKAGIKFGCKKYHLGGGLTDSADDTLFQFKRGFSKNFADFYIGKRIHNKDIYEKIIAEWETKAGKKAVRLLEYRTET